MDLSNLKSLCWNVNSLRKRVTDLHSYILSHDLDVIALQEVDVNGIGLQFTGYQRFELLADPQSNMRFNHLC